MAIGIRLGKLRAEHKPSGKRVRGLTYGSAIVGAALGSASRRIVTPLIQKAG